MKRVGYLYEKMCDLALIKLAIHKAAQGKTRKHYIAKVLANEEKGTTVPARLAYSYKRVRIL